MRALLLTLACLAAELALASFVGHVLGKRREE